MQHHYIITFDSTHDALHAEKQLKDWGFPARIVPLPPVLAAGCGFSVQIPEDVIQGVQIKMAVLPFEAIYAVEKDGLKKNYTLCLSSVNIENGE